MERSRGWHSDTDIIGWEIIMQTVDGERRAVVEAEHYPSGSMKARDSQDVVWIGNQWDVA